MIRAFACLYSVCFLVLNLRRVFRVITRMKYIHVLFRITIRMKYIHISSTSKLWEELENIQLDTSYHCGLWMDCIVADIFNQQFVSFMLFKYSIEDFLDREILVSLFLSFWWLVDKFLVVKVSVVNLSYWTFLYHLSFLKISSYFLSS